MLGEGETCTGTQSPFYRFAPTSPPLPAQRPLFAFNVRAKSILNRSPISIRAKVKAVEPADYKNRITRCKSGVRNLG